MTPLTPEQVAEIDARFEAGETIWMWCIHHDVRCEPLTEPLSNRIDFITTRKPERERSTRLQWLQPVRQPELLPKAYVEAWKAYDDAMKAREETWKAYVEAVKARDEAEKAYVGARKVYFEAWEVFKAAYKAHEPAIAALHEEACPGVPWGEEGLIFEA